MTTLLAVIAVSSVVVSLLATPAMVGYSWRERVALAAASAAVSALLGSVIVVLAFTITGGHP